MSIKNISIFIPLSFLTFFVQANLTTREGLKHSEALSFTYDDYNHYFNGISKQLNGLLIEPKSPMGKTPDKAIYIHGKVDKNKDFLENVISINNIKIIIDHENPTRYSSLYGISVKESNTKINNIDIMSNSKNYYGISNRNNDAPDSTNLTDPVKSIIIINDSSMEFNGDGAQGIKAIMYSINKDSFNKVEFNNSTLNFNGESSRGILSLNSSVKVNNSTINLNNLNDYTFNTTSYGIYALNNADVSMNNSTISSESNNAVGIFLRRENSHLNDETLLTNNISYIENKQLVKIENKSKINLKNSTAIYSDAGNSIVNVNNSSILSENLIKTDADDKYADDLVNLTLNVSNGSDVTGRTLTNKYTESSINLSSGSIWNVTGDSSLTNLNVTDDSVVNFKKDGDNNFTTTVVDTLDGNNATYNFAVDIANKNSSKLIINKLSDGDHIVEVTNDGSQNTMGTEKVLLVTDNSDENLNEKNLVKTVSATSANATFKNEKDIELGGYKYEVRRDDENSNNWVLTAKKDEGKINDTAKSITGLASSSYLLNQAELTTLRQRMGDLITDKATSSEDISEVWGRVYGGRYKTRDNANLAKVNMNYYGFQLGGDMNTIKEGDDKNHLGVFIGHTTGKPDYVRGDSTVESWYGGFYDTFISEDNFYIDSVIKFGQYRNKYNLNDSQDNALNGKVKSNVLTLSSEVGKRFMLTSNDAYNLYLEPQAQLTWSRIGSFKTGASNGLNVKQDAYNSLISRLGASLGSQINKQSDVYLKASYLHEFKNDVKYKLNNSEESYNVQGNGVEIGIGGNVKLNENGYLYLEANYINSHAHYTGSKFNVGYRYSF